MLRHSLARPGHLDQHLLRQMAWSSPAMTLEKEDDHRGLLAASIC